ncbi:aminopeptidase [Mycolicibacterium sp. Dal123E01]|uniref:aminopeptidase n=1 Tax=Mycolicibacterium sp. Dal123E01 TaxID=3457578 RepID=UPI00403E3806
MAMRRVILLVGAVLLVAGVIALLIPVSTSNGNGGSIGCGNAVSADLSAAREANNKGIVANVPILNEIVPHTDFVAQCQSAVSSRRGWSIPLTVVGLVVLAGSFVVGGRRGVGSTS